MFAYYNEYLNILKEELLPAMGCTEPIAVAYAAALARDALSAEVEECEISVSGNILKNVKSVIVPNTGGLKGVISAAAAGIAKGRHQDGLQVLASVKQEDYPAISECVSRVKFKVEQSESGCVFDIAIRVNGGGHTAFARLEGHHTNIVRLERDGETLIERTVGEGESGGMTDRSVLSVKGIIEFIDGVNVSDIEEVISRQLDYNLAIAEEGLKNDYGARVGKILMDALGDEIHNKAKAYAAAGSDARMNGCSLPVVIVSGSGNQGMAASLPVLVYAREMNCDRQTLLRAVALSDLITVHLKTGIGRLSAYCGAVSAGAGAGAGIAYLNGGKLDEIAHTVVNALAITSGLICDGAKSSCAAKIATAVEAGLMGYEMYKRGSQFYGGEGILERGVENTIDNVGDLARIGMKGTDEEIIRLMIKTI